MNTRMFTEDELTSAVQEAVAPVKAELDALHASLAEGEVENRIDAIRAETETHVAELQAKLDAAEIRANEAEAARDEVFAWLRAEADAVAAAAEHAERTEARLALVKDSANFSDEYVAENIDRWVAMDDESFAALVEDWKAVQTAARASHEDADLAGIPVETAMDTARTTTTTTGSDSVVGEVFNLIRQGVDPRTIS